MEARDRLGGRTYTLVDEDEQQQRQENESMTANNTSTPSKSHSIHIDMGATWVHGGKQSGQPIAVLANAMGYKLMNDNTEDERLYDLDARKFISPQKMEQAHQSFEATLKKAKKHAKSVESRQKQDISIQQALESVNPVIVQDPLQQYLIRQWLEFDFGGTADTISGAHFDEDSEFHGADSIPSQGYKPIVERLANGLDIQLETQVSTIEYDTKGVRLFTNRGIYEAKRVVCTIPLGVLKSGAVSFQPGLSESKQRAINRLGWGVVNKVALLFKKVFWPPKQSGFGVVSTETPFCQYILNKYPFTQVPMLEAYIVGKQAQRMADLSDEEVVNNIIHELSIMFGQTVDMLEDSLIQKIYIQRWEKEEFTRGAYSYAIMGSKADDFEAFEYSQLKVLFFAGEHTSVDYRGTAHGAFLSGRRAARDILSTLEDKSRVPAFSLLVT
ncbi:polyamine oxidase [Nitzschia inconspicua]|uniref:Polyamine oxidase n=1 Tax=Nitzschia inconspicua TaxID=303405 RepID=A0A9K3KUH0_9STRA|nr:polyamine oxidase [Nitzschia inconspicua]